VALDVHKFSIVAAVLPRAAGALSDRNDEDGDRRSSTG
jgi:hypothetical protein